MRREGGGGRKKRGGKEGGKKEGEKEEGKVPFFFSVDQSCPEKMIVYLFIYLFVCFWLV